MALLKTDSAKDILKQLQQIEELLEQAKTEKARLEGSLHTIIEQLKKEYAIQPKDIDKKLKELTDQLERNNKSLTTAIEKLENAYDWDSAL